MNDTQPKPIYEWTEWRELFRDGRQRALCWNCGYPELIGSDDCRNCSTNFDSRRIVLTQPKPTGEYANVHIEHYFPKGYDPGGEPWKSIRKHHNAALAAQPKPTAEGMPGGYGKPWRVPTGEWTVSTIDEWISLNPSTWRSVIAFEHNAALAAERETYDLDHERCEICNSELSQCGMQGVDGEPSLDCLVCTLRDQLAAERDKVQTLVGALKSVRKDNDELWTDVTTEWRAKLHHQIRTIIDAALAKVKK